MPLVFSDGSEVDARQHLIALQELLEADLRKLVGETIIFLTTTGKAAPCSVGGRGKLVNNPELERFLSGLRGNTLHVVRVSETEFLIRATTRRGGALPRRPRPRQLSFLHQGNGVAGGHPGEPGAAVARAPSPGLPRVRVPRVRAGAAGDAIRGRVPGPRAARARRRARLPKPPGPETASPLQGLLDAAELQQPPVPELEVEVRFHPEEDEAVLGLAQGTAPGPPSDLALHRQALGLMLNPGFDTLLALPVTRGVEPLDYQLATVRHVLKHLRGRALLCDEVGLGKTVEAGLIATEYMLRGLVRRILVLTPPSLVEQWQGELRTKFNLDFVTYDDPAFRAHPDPWRAFPRILASLDTAKLAGHKERILLCDFDLVIVDEAHHLKNARTQAHQLVKNLHKKYILLLTATPVENRLEELFNLITLLTPGQLETAASFKRNYISPKDPLKPRNTAGLRELIREVMVRNRRSETAVITSRRHAEVVEVSQSPDETGFYRELSAFVREHYAARSAWAGGLNQLVLKGLQRAAGSSVEAVAPTLEKLASGRYSNSDSDSGLAAGRALESLCAAAREVTGRAKGDAVAALLRRIGEKTVVFTGFRETQRFLVERLRQEGMRVAVLHGGMRRQEKEEQVEHFRTGAGVLVSTEGGSEGRNLHFARVLVNYDLPWNPMRIEQRIGRLHRLGQTQDVYVYNLSAAGTIESHILHLLDAKINMFQLVIGELDTILGNLGDKKPFEDLAMDIWSSARDREELNRGMEALGEMLIAAKRQYEAVKRLDDNLLSELLPRE